MSKSKKIKLLIFLILLLIGVNYNFIDNFLKKTFIETETGVVERVIDGDTIVLYENDSHVRMLGINTPEKGEEYSAEAKQFLEMVILNKTIELKFGKQKYDLYKRKLAYVFLNEKDINLELVYEGYANFYFPSGKDSYYEDFARAWGHCLENGKYLCEKSKDECSSCVILKNLDYKTQEAVFSNICGFDCNLTNWKIKDEGRKNFIFPNFILSSNKEIKIIAGNKTNNANELFWKGEEYVWTKTGDTLFLRDDKGKLVLWKNY